jgi:apolipoprotein N-acyltransferase
MNSSPEKGPSAYAAYIGVAFVSAAASVVIALIALSRFSQVSDGAMWAMAAMILTPALLGIGVAYFVNRTAEASRGAPTPDQPSQPTAGQEGHFRESRPFEGRGGK